jgi:hypothetical protein
LQGVILPQSWALLHLGRPAASAFFTLLLRHDLPIAAHKRPLTLLAAVMGLLGRRLSSREALRGFLRGDDPKRHVPEEQVLPRSTLCTHRVECKPGFQGQQWMLEGNKDNPDKQAPVPSLHQSTNTPLFNNHMCWCAYWLRLDSRLAANTVHPAPQFAYPSITPWIFVILCLLRLRVALHLLLWPSVETLGIWITQPKLSDVDAEQMHTAPNGVIVAAAVLSVSR